MLARTAFFLYNRFMQFSKYHGLGNDFVLVDMSASKLSDFSKAAQILCNRRTGIGADGLVLLWPIDEENAKMRIFNADGSEAEMCGNVSRCAPLFWRQQGHLKGTHLILHTLAGPIDTEIIDEDKKLIRVNMGAPRLTRGEIPMTGTSSEQAINVSLQANGQEWKGTGVSMGNPHFVIFVEDINKIDLPTVGPALETHIAFPRKTNVEFVQKIDEHTLRMRVWERGVGITQACGTGACATLVASVLTKHTGKQARILLDGGELAIEWNKNGNVLMTGPAQKVFDGEYTDSL